jgi:hypothetical protein
VPVSGGGGRTPGRRKVAIVDCAAAGISIHEFGFSGVFVDGCNATLLCIAPPDTAQGVLNREPEPEPSAPAALARWSASAATERAAVAWSVRKWQVWVEPLFAEAKEWHGLCRLRLRGLLNANIEGWLIAAGQNLKRFLAVRSWGHRHAPCGSLLALPRELGRLSAVFG